MDFGLGTRPTSSVIELARDLINLMRLLGALSRAFVIEAKTIGTASTSVDHGLSRRPRWCFAFPRGDARLWRSADPDNRNVYLQASTSVVVDVFIVP